MIREGLKKRPSSPYGAFDTANGAPSQSRLAYRGRHFAWHEGSDACVDAIFAPCGGLNAPCGALNGPRGGLNTSCGGLNTSCGGLNASCGGLNLTLIHISEP